MEIIDKVKNSFDRWQRQKAIKILTRTDPEKLAAFGENKLIPAFQRAAKRVPVYGRLLKEKGINPAKIKDIDSFKKLVPVLEKKDIFPGSEIEDLCLDGDLFKMRSAMSSSGFFGVFSFGLNAKKNLKDSQKTIDVGLDYAFDISHKKTLLINCLPMGVKISTSLQYVETSVRSDMALAVFKKISPKFDQTIFVGDPHFLKKLIEEGMEQGIDWKNKRVHLVMGDDYVAESFQRYLTYLIGADLDRPKEGLVAMTFGIAELDLNLFHESVYSIRIRRAAQKNKDLRYALFGEGTEACPNLFHYYPHRTFLESVSQPGRQPELVFSMLSKNLLIPLIRYNSKDTGKTLSYNRLKEILTKYGYSDLIPDLKLPLVIVGGRQDNAVRTGNNLIAPEEIKQGLYEDFDLAGKTTGYFRLSQNDQWPKLEIQLKKDVLPNDELENKFKSALFKYTVAELPVVLYKYRDFPYGMELDYERKFKNL